MAHMVSRALIRELIDTYEGRKMTHARTLHELLPQMESSMSLRSFTNRRDPLS